MFKSFLKLFILILLASGCHQKELATQRETIDKLKLEIIKLENALSANNKVKLSRYGSNKQLHELLTRLRQELNECKHFINKIEEPEEFPVTILPVSLMHNDELEENYQQHNWIGLCKRSDNYYLERVKIDFLKVHDPIIDAASEKTGWQPQVEGKQDTCLYLFSGLDIAGKSMVEFVELEQKVILPGDTLHFNFLDRNYMLFATGDNPGGESYGVSDYKLYLQSDLKNNPQALVYEYQFDDDIIDILWAGDLDGDQIMDLIIDTSNHYNVMELSLFLSSYSTGQDLVKKVGHHRKIGC